MKNGNRLVMALVAGAMLVFSVSQAQALAPARVQSRSGACVRPRVDDIRGGNGGLPSPFGLANRVFELAAGEEYVLFGRLRLNGSQVALEIDFEKQPWLASDARCANPFYPLRAVPEAWLRFSNRAVRLRVTAAVEILRTSFGSLIQEILLSPANPADGRVTDILVFEDTAAAAPHEVSRGD